MDLILKPRPGGKDWKMTHQVFLPLLLQELSVWEIHV